MQRLPHAHGNPVRPFAVGVVGHRPNRLPADLRGLAAALRNVLGIIRDEVSNAPLPLCAVSPLAEGADRIFAEQALDLEFSLTCPMPFPQGEYERDFAPGVALEVGSLLRFRKLLEQFARSSGLTVVELSGSRLDPDAAYAAAGADVLDASDLLVAVWDGKAGASPAGTEAVMAKARRRDIPMVVVSATPPHVVTCAPREPRGAGGVIEGAAWEPVTESGLRALVADALGRRR